MRKYKYLAVPVVDEKNKLIGLITVDDVVDVIAEEATEDVQRMGAGEVPPHLRGTGYPGAKRLGHGKGYLYPHDYPGGWVAQQYLPDGAPSGRHYYEPTDRGAEQSIRQRLEELRRTE